MPAFFSGGKKPRRALFFFCACLLPFFVSCATPPFHAEKRRTVPEDFFGIAPYRRPVTPEDFPLIDNLGVVWQRRTCRWSSLEIEPGKWDFADWDNYVTVSKNAGKKLLAILGYDNYWIYEKPTNRRKITARELPAYLNYVETVVRRYRGKIDAYEIWNEPNMASWYGSNEEFITMTRAAIKKVRSIDPDVKILTGSFLRVPDGLVRDMARAGVFDEADGISFHPYAMGPGGAVRLCDAMLELLEKEGVSGEIWITEMGYPTHGWYPSRVTEKNFPSRIVKTLSGLAARDIKVLLWYELFDSESPADVTDTGDSENFFGIVYPDRSVKAGYNAFALCGRNLAGREYRPELPERKDLPKRTVSLCFTGPENVLILWNEWGASYTAKINLPGTDRRLYDINSGEFVNLGEEAEITVTKKPLFFIWKEAARGENILSLPSVEKQQ